MWRLIADSTKQQIGNAGRMTMLASKRIKRTTNGAEHTLVFRQHRPGRR